MRFLGIDFGTKRVGVAIADDTNVIAFPKQILSNDKNLISALTEIITDENITDVVLGESSGFDGKPNKVAKEADLFGKELSKSASVRVHKQKEFLTSVEARKSEELSVSDFFGQSHSRVKKRRGGKIDSSAAALILQRFLDRLGKQKKN